jgi:nucleotide-binding universal stress UspA family protein
MAVTVIQPRPWHGDPTGSHVVLGARLGRDPRVVASAASLVHRMGASLVCVWADPQRAVVERGSDGTVVTVPLEAHRGDDEQTASAARWMAVRLANTLDRHAVPWRFVYTAGDPAQQLHLLAEEPDAVAIALGTRDPGVRAWVTEKSVGSVAQHLTHHQHRPVILFPAPADADTARRG